MFSIYGFAVPHNDGFAINFHNQHRNHRVNTLHIKMSVDGFKSHLMHSKNVKPTFSSYQSYWWIVDIRNRLGFSLYLCRSHVQHCDKYVSIKSTPLIRPFSLKGFPRYLNITHLFVTHAVLYTYAITRHAHPYTHVTQNTHGFILTQAYTHTLIHTLGCLPLGSVCVSFKSHSVIQCNWYTKTPWMQWF